MLNLISCGGLCIMVMLAWCMSSHRARISWRLVGIGVASQLTLGAIFFNSQRLTFNGRFENGILFAGFDGFFKWIQQWTTQGASFVFKFNGLDDASESSRLLSSFAFGVLPTVIFFAALMSVLYHLRLVQPVVRLLAWMMQKALGTSGSESLAAAANVFVGHTEAPLVVKPYIAGMTVSELNAMMVGGFATITGGLMAVFVDEGISAGHLVTASILSAPAALVIAKIMLPETGESETLGEVRAQLEISSANVVEAAAQGASDGLKLALNIGAMLIAFLALIAMIDTLLMFLGEACQWLCNALWFGFADQAINIELSLEAIFGYLFAPLALVMGIESADCQVSGELLGTKMVFNEFVAYVNLGQILDGTNEEAKVLSERSEVILTYALCGFSNFGAIGIQLGGIGPLAPSRRKDLARLGLRAMFGGMLACCMTACVAGIYQGWLD